MEYSDTNEDVEHSLRCLDVHPGQVVVGILGSGDVLLRALARSPAFVAGYDTNPAQVALAELKRAAMGRLSYDDYAVLLGYGEGRSRVDLLHEVLRDFDDDIRAFWQRPDMLQSIDMGLWRSGTATRKDLLRWQEELLKLKKFLGSKEFSVVLGFEGTREQRASIRKKVARALPHYAEPAIRNNNHFKFDPFRYPDGMVASPESAKFAAAFLPSSMLRPSLSKEEYEKIRPHLQRSCFQNLSIHQALEEAPVDAIDRVYLSNITDYFTVEQERSLIELLIEKGSPAAVTVVLFTALSPSQHRDLLDHEQWSERGLSRFLQRSSWQRKMKDAPVAAWVASVGRSFGNLGKIDQERLRRAALWARDHDYVETGKKTARLTSEALQSGYRLLRNQWLESRQLADHDFVLIENQSRSHALYSDISANHRATHASRSFYGFAYAILHKVRRCGATYALPDAIKNEI